MTKKKRARRNIKVVVDDSLPEGVTEEEYRILEEQTEKEELKPLRGRKVDAKAEDYGITDEQVLNEIKYKEQAGDDVVSEEFKEKIRNSADLARKENFEKGLPIVYMDDDRDIVYEYPDGTVKKKKDLPEDEWLSKKYDDRLDTPEDKWIELEPGESAID
jgi:nitric oxide synthase oxygenase domain/subunit